MEPIASLILCLISGGGAMVAHKLEVRFLVRDDQDHRSSMTQHARQVDIKQD